MKKVLVVLLTATLLLAGCSNKESENKKVDDLLSLEDEIYYVEKGSDLDKLFKLDEGSSLTVDGDYDLSKEGRYIVKFIVTDKAGKTNEQEKTIVVDEKEKLEDIKKEDEAKKEADHSISNEQPTETDKTEEDGETTSKENEEIKTQEEKNANSSNVSNASSSSNKTLDTSNPMIKAAYDLEGTEGGCEYIASLYLNNVGMPPKAGKLQEISSPFTGAFVKYYDDNWNYKHTAIYLADGMCLHGNYSDGKAKVASCALYSHQVYEDPQTLANVEPVDTSELEKDPYDGKGDQFTPEMCAVPITDLASGSSALAFWCYDNHKDLIIMD